VPVVEPSEFSEPITISPRATPVNPKLPVVASAALCAATVAEVNAAVPKLTAVSFGLVLLVPTWRVPTVTRPVLLIVAEAIVPSVFVPVEEVKPVAKVVTPLIVGIVAVEIVAVLIVAVPIVAVPAVAEMLELKVATPVTPRLEDSVTAPVTPRLEDRVAAPVTPRLEDRVAAPVTPRLEDKVTAPVTAKVEAKVVAPTALSVPVEFTPVVDNCKAEDTLLPSVIV